MFNLDIMKRLVMEAFIELMEGSKFNVPPTINEVKQRIIRNIDAKCYDITLEISEENIDIMEIIKVLDILKMCYIYRGVRYNESQNILFKF